MNIAAAFWFRKKQQKHNSKSLLKQKKRSFERFFYVFKFSAGARSNFSQFQLVQLELDIELGEFFEQLTWRLHPNAARRQGNFNAI